MWWILVIAAIMSLAILLGVLTWRSAGNPADERFNECTTKSGNFEQTGGGAGDTSP